MIYILDTNIISEFMKPRANYGVIDWAQDHNSELFITTVTIMELQYGIMRMPDGKRKRALFEAINAITKECADRTLVFDGFSAYLCADMRCQAQRTGFTPQIADCMIAAICKRNDAVLVTHNVKDFESYGIELFDPFDYESPLMKELRGREKTE